MNSSLSPAQINRLKHLLLVKGVEINDKLTSLLNHQRAPLEGLLGGKPGETPLERLRGFMVLIDRNLSAIRDGRYGRCLGCGGVIPFEQLEGMPWSDTCLACTQKSE